jgi:hypothetical protein
MFDEKTIKEIESGGGYRNVDIYRIYHLTYSEKNAEGFPKYKEFAGILAVKEYIESEFVKGY